MGSVEKQRINASNMLNTRFFMAFYLFPMGIVIPIILKITYHTFSHSLKSLSLLYSIIMSVVYKKSFYKVYTQKGFYMDCKSLEADA